ncbi:MAG: C40 family peptidase [Deltaproteobacteria bacterium]|jgi:LysM repeat protein|nr:C40 family peptidase [Deltaproteobacteria bacterium]
MNAISAKTTSAAGSKKLLPLLLALVFASLIISLGGCAKKTYIVRYKPIPRPAYTGNEKNVNSILQTAFSQIGNPYRYGGNSPETGFDCSGFVSWVYKQYGVSLPRSSRDMMTAGIPIEREDLRPGDLVFFNYGYSHVGIYTGNDKYIHSPRTGKSIQESDLNGRGRSERFVAARRIIDNQGINSISEGLKAQWISQSRHQVAQAISERTAARLNTASVRTSSPRTAQSSVKIKIVSGDTLVDLARKYHVSVNDLASANNLRNRNQLKLGQVLVVPQKAAAAKTVQTASAKPAKKAASNLTARLDPKKTKKAAVKSSGKKSKTVSAKSSSKKTKTVKASPAKTKAGRQALASPAKPLAKAAGPASKTPAASVSAKTKTNTAAAPPAKAAAKVASAKKPGQTLKR